MRLEDGWKLVCIDQMRFSISHPRKIFKMLIIISNKKFHHLQAESHIKQESFDMLFLVTLYFHEETYIYVYRWITKKWIYQKSYLQNF